jgi:RNA polymerase sigma factor (sigma-70 family)
MTEAAAPHSAHLERPPGLSGDERLARRAAAGDRQAFAAIYRRYQAELYRFCLAIVGNGPDAQDALQNTMVQALRALPGERRQVKLKPWLYRVARNESINVIRGRRPTDDLDPDQVVDGGEITGSVEARERLRGLLADLRELPERQRAALVMRELAGLAFAEIGAAFDTSAAVARQTVYEARLGLREMEAGREMTCAEATREISGADGRVLRRREIRAHLRACEDCRRFRDAIAERRGELAAIAPLPAVASAGVLHAVLGGSNAAGGGTLAGAGTAGTVAGKALAGSGLAKSLAALALIAAAGGVAADRSGLIETPIPGGSHGAGAPASSSALESASRRAESGENPWASAGPGGLRRNAASGAHAGIEGGKPGTIGGHTLNGGDGQTQKGGRGPGGAAGNPPHSTGALPAAASHGQTTAESHGDGRSNAHTHGGGGHGGGSSQGAAHSHAGGHGTGAHEGGGQSKEHSASPPQEGRSEHTSKTGPSSSHSSDPPAQHGAGQQAGPETTPTKPLQPSKLHPNLGGTAEGERPTY